MITRNRDATEQTIKEGLITLNEYLKIFNDQLVRPLATAKDVYYKMSITEFLPQIIEDLMFFCVSYYDSVRDEASRALLFIGNHFMRFETTLTKDHHDMLQVMRANLTEKGFDESYTTPIKECAEMEKSVSTHIFKDAQAFISKLLQIMLDEPSTREALSKFIIRFNLTLPFLVMNEYRIAQVTNSLMRAELLKKILQKSQF